MAQKSRPLMLAALATVPLIMVLGNSMLIPVLPKIKQELGISQFQVSLLITLFSIPAGIVIPFAGFLSDRLTRKKIIAPALLIYGLGGLIAGAGAIFFKGSGAYWVILGGRVIQGLGAAGTAPIAMALASDIFAGKGRSKALGIIEASNGMGKVLSPILGSVIALIAWFAAFFLFPALCVPAALAVWFLVKEPTSQKQTKSTKKYFESIKNIFKTKGAFLVSAFLAGAVALFLVFGLLVYLSDILESKYHIFTFKKGLVLAIPVLAMSTTSFVTGMLVQKKKNLQRYLTLAGLLLLAVSLAGLPWFTNLYIFMAIFAVSGISVGLILPCLNTLITSSVSIEERGMVTSLYGGVRFIGVALGPPLFGLLDQNKLLLFGACVGLALVTLGVCAFLLKPPKSPSQAKDQNQENAQNKNYEASAKDKDTAKSKAKGQKAGAGPQPGYACSEEVVDQVIHRPIRKSWGQRIFETITFRNTVGRLVLAKPFPEEIEEKENLKVTQCHKTAPMKDPLTEEESDEVYINDHLRNYAGGADMECECRVISHDKDKNKSEE